MWRENTIVFVYFIFIVTGGLVLYRRGYTSVLPFDKKSQLVFEVKLASRV